MGEEGGRGDQQMGVSVCDERERSRCLFGVRDMRQ